MPSPPWQGSVPDSVFIATDGSGNRGGTWAFIAWGHIQGRWHRIGWDAGRLDCTPWLPPACRHAPPHLASFYGELAALESAGLWMSALADWWQLHMGSRPRLVTTAVDNSAALQIAAGHSQAAGTAAALARYAWQSVQSPSQHKLSPCS